MQHLNNKTHTHTLRTIISTAELFGSANLKHTQAGNLKEQGKRAGKEQTLAGKVAKLKVTIVHTQRKRKSAMDTAAAAAIS